MRKIILRFLTASVLVAGGVCGIVSANAGPMAVQEETLTTAPTARSFYVVLTALPGDEGQVARLLSDLAADIRGERGCVRFQVFRMKDNMNIFHIDETYFDDMSFEEHLKIMKSRKFMEALKPLIKDGKFQIFGLTPVA